MKTMKMLLIAGLIFVHLGAPENSAAQGVVIPQFPMAKPSKKISKIEEKKAATKEESMANVELLRMISPDGNEVVFSLSSEVMGRSLKASDFSIAGVEQDSMALICQQTVREDLELRRAELKLELELMIEDLKTTEKPRFLSGTQRAILKNTPSCEMFRLSLTAISKLLDGYDYTGMETASIRR